MDSYVKFYYIDKIQNALFAQRLMYSVSEKKLQHCTSRDKVAKLSMIK